MGRMPHSNPDELAEVLHTLGISPLRTGILQVIQRRGTATAQNLMDELHVSRSRLGPHLKILVDAGVLVEGPDPAAAGARSGFNRLLWRINETVLDQHLEYLVSALHAQ